MRRKPGSMRGLEELGRVRLSRFFFVRDFLYSEIGNVHGIPNIPSDPDLAIAVGEKLCVELLDPIVETFGPIHLRSSFRSVEVNGYGAANKENCASNESNHAGHIWDRRDANGHMGATACIVVPWFADRYEEGRDWRDMAWWVHDHLPYREAEFFPKLAAFNLSWHEDPTKPRRLSAWMHSPRVIFNEKDPARAEPERGRERRYADFPAFRGLREVLPR